MKVVSNMEDCKKKLYYPFTESPDDILDRLINKYGVHIQLHFIRTSQHLTQEEASVLSDISVSTISRLETGGDVRLTNVIKYAHSLGYELRLVKKGAQYGYTEPK